MITFLQILLAVAAAYCLGSVSMGVIVAKAFGQDDIRAHGSGGTGMTNVMRTLGWLPSFLTFAGDVLKGVLGAYLGKLIAGEIGMHIGGLMAVVGHNWPMFFDFRGGKGMSTSLGYVFIADWRIALILLGIQIIIVVISGLMSLASVTTAILLIVLNVIFHTGSWMYIVFSIFISLLALYSHRKNLERLSNGTENKLDARKISQISKRVLNRLKDRSKNRHE